MKFGELTIAQILLSAFSGIAVAIFSWIIGKRIIGRFRTNDKGNTIIQKNNKVGGSMAGDHIKETDNIQSIDTKRHSTEVDQSGNIVSGDIAGGSIIKNKE